MSQILAFTEQPGELRGAVVDVAAAIARLVGAQVRAVATGPVDGVRLASELALAELRKPDAELAVLSAQPGDSLGWRIVQDATKPVVLVPSAVSAPASDVSRVLLPLDGTAEAAQAVAEAMDLFVDAGVDQVVLHVFDATTVPPFWDQAAHTRAVWEQEFLARNCGDRPVRLALRSGRPGERVADVAADEKVDLIVLGWSRNLGPGRARTVRHTVLDARVPVMLVPVVTS